MDGESKTRTRLQQLNDGGMQVDGFDKGEYGAKLYVTIGIGEVCYDYEN
jgi:hypothetical protein